MTFPFPEKWWENPEVSWEECYDLFRREMEEVCKTYKILIPELPLFTKEEVDLLDELCASKPWFGYLLKGFYAELYDLLIGLEKGERITARNLTDIGYFLGFAKHELLDFAKGRQKIANSIIDKHLKTKNYFSAVVEAMGAIRS